MVINDLSYKINIHRFDSSFLSEIKKKRSSLKLKLLMINQAAIKKNQQIKAKPIKNMPQIITPKINQQKGRRFIDSQQGTRPESSRAVESAKKNVQKFKVREPDVAKEVKQQVIQEAKSSKYSNLLDLLSKVADNFSEAVLDQIMVQIQQITSEEFFEIDFHVYNVLTNTLFSLITNVESNNDINKSESSVSRVLFKSLAICLLVIPEADREYLDNITKIMYTMSKDPNNDELFISTNIIPVVTRNAFSDNINDITTFSAAILRHISSNYECRKELMKKTDVVKLICKSLQTRSRKERFNSQNITYFYQVIGLFIEIAEKIKDWSFMSKSPLSLFILEISTIYDSNPLIQHQIAKCFSTLMLHVEAVEEIETEELIPLFSLIRSTNDDVAEQGLLALANAVSQSDIVTSQFVHMLPPFGTTLLLTMLKTEENTSKIASICRCLAKASFFQKGSEDIWKLHNLLIPLLDTELDDLDSWTDEQLIVANVLVILKNLCVNHLTDVSNLMKGKMRQLMYYGVYDYVVDLMKLMLTCQQGFDVCQEVADVDEIKLLIPGFGPVKE